jgi:uncharacterized membrane protein
MPSPAQVASAAFSLDAVYVLTGVVLWAFAALNFADRRKTRRAGSSLFWLILGTIFALGSLMPHWLAGALVILMVALDGAHQVERRDKSGETTKETNKEIAGETNGRVGRGAARENADQTTSKTAGAAGRETTKTGQAVPKSRALGGRIFLPVLAIPFVTFAFAIIFRLSGADANRGALVGLGFGGVAALAVGIALTRGTVREAFQEGRRLNDAMGAVNILPPLLASLGVIFAASKVGDLIAGGIQHVIPGESLFLLVAANCLGMALFTMVMGNSFAAFPVIASGVLVPLIVRPFGVDPAMAAIVTLTAGSTGTLMTPMAANFNIVPAALLDMRDQYGVIKFQTPYALTIWALHVVVLWLMIRVAG